MRSVRAWHGTNWCAAALAAKKLGKDPPPNPLQHTNPKMTMRHYQVRVGLATDPRRISKAREAKQRAKEKRGAARGRKADAPTGILHSIRTRAASRLVAH